MMISNFSCMFSKSQYFPDHIGILLASGENWTRMRRFTIKALRDHGFGKKASETYILDEALHMVEYLR